VKINGEYHWLWRTVNQEGEVLEGCDTERQNRKAVLAQKAGGKIIPAVLSRSAPCYVFGAC
jgi:hypothetical protein